LGARSFFCRGDWPWRPGSRGCEGCEGRGGGAMQLTSIPKTAGVGGWDLKSDNKEFEGFKSPPFRHLLVDGLDPPVNRQNNCQTIAFLPISLSPSDSQPPEETERRAAQTSLYLAKIPPYPAATGIRCPPAHASHNHTISPKADSAQLPTSPSSRRLTRRSSQGLCSVPGTQLAMEPQAAAAAGGGSWGAFLKVGGARPNKYVDSPNR
jgi:hypothetical protein